MAAAGAALVGEAAEPQRTVRLASRSPNPEHRGPARSSSWRSSSESAPRRRECAAQSGSERRPCSGRWPPWKLEASACEILGFFCGILFTVAVLDWEELLALQRRPRWQRESICSAGEALPIASGTCQSSPQTDVQSIGHRHGLVRASPSLPGKFWHRRRRSLA